MDLGRFARLFNLAEAALWGGIALALLARTTWRRGATRRRYALAGLTFLAFGGSDLAEAAINRGWWSPRWLLLWKAACVVALLGLAAEAWRSRNQAGASGPNDARK